MSLALTPAARQAATAASALATTCAGPAAVGARQVGDGEQRPPLAALGLGQLAVDDLVAGAARRLVLREHRIARRQAEEPDHRRVRAHGRPVRQRRDGRIVRVEHDRPAVPDLLGDQRLDVNQLVEVVDAVVAEVIGGDVGDHGDVGLVVAQAPPDDAAARGLQHRRLDCRVVEHHLGRPRARRRRRRRRAGRRRRRRRCRTCPTRSPACRSTWPIMRTVVVLPFVPVTEITGIRAGAPGGYRLSTTAAATSRGLALGGGQVHPQAGARVELEHCARLGRAVAGRIVQRRGDVGEPQVDAADVQAGQRPRRGGTSRPPRRARGR